jgi:hypothetical protein
MAQSDDSTADVAATTRLGVQPVLSHAREALEVATLPTAVRIELGAAARGTVD